MPRKPDQPNPGKRSRFRPGDPVMLHGRVLEVIDLDGKTMIVCSIRGWPVTNGRVYAPEEDVEPDPRPE
jgi:hypothetical protein